MKTYVLDTSVLCADPDAITKFDEHQIILPITVIQELDGLKKGSSDAAKNARMVSRKIKELCDKHGHLNDFVPINDKGGQLKVTIEYRGCKVIQKVGGAEYAELDLDLSINDNKIINTAWLNDAILVTKDNNLRIIALAHGCQSEDYRNEQVDVSGLYTGLITDYVDQEVIDVIYEDGYVGVSGETNFIPNQCVILKSGQQSALGIYDAKNENVRLVPQAQKFYDIQPKNTEQKFLLELLFNPEIKLLTVTGKPGSGKSLLAVIAGLYQAMEQKRYKKLVVTRAPVAVDNDYKLGFLPGTALEKMMPWLGPLSDSLDFSMGKIKSCDKKDSGRKKKKHLDDDEDFKDIGKTNPVIELIEMGFLEVPPIESIRGRSIRESFIIIEEAQNLTHHAIKTIVSRAGEGAKIVLLGDIKQVDAPYLDAGNNGLVNVIEKFRGQNLYAHINLVKSERSELAELADRLL